MKYKFEGLIKFIRERRTVSAFDTYRKLKRATYPIHITSKNT